MKNWLVSTQSPHDEPCHSKGVPPQVVSSWLIASDIKIRYSQSRIKGLLFYASIHDSDERKLIPYTVSPIRKDIFNRFMK